MYVDEKGSTLMTDVEIDVANEALEQELKKSFPHLFENVEDTKEE